MDNSRVKELSNFVNNFNKKLELSEEQLIKDIKLKKLRNNRNKKNKLLFQRESSFTPRPKPKLSMNKDLFKPLLPWVPNSLVGKYFNKFEKLNDKHNLTAWEKVIFYIINISKYIYL